ncbi:MAG TPA: ABC transporter substrate-binding protein [Candidatus Binatia bacterium]|nr:ABC transporter substrate-binding protein [Candidatus Binatia bacterium]
MRRYRTLALGAAALVLVVSACTPGGSEAGSPNESEAATKPDVSVGSAGFWESAVVAEMYAQALEAAGYPVERHLEIGERPAVHAAFDAGEINLMPEYLGGLAGQGLGLAELPTDPEAAWDNLQEPLAEKGWVIFDYSPGTDADGFAVRSETAEELGLETMSDLAAVDVPLTWGVAPGCVDNPVCAPGLNEVYGIDISQFDVVMLEPCSTDIATALSDEAIDVAQVCTTQPEIVSMNFKLLDDDMHLQPAQNLVPMADQELADAAPADFAETLTAIQAKLTTEALTELGVAINVNQESIEDVARGFLEDNGLL